MKKLLFPLTQPSPSEGRGIIRKPQLCKGLFEEGGVFVAPDKHIPVFFFTGLTRSPVSGLQCFYLQRSALYISPPIKKSRLPKLVRGRE